MGVISYSIISGGCYVHASFHWKSALLKHQHAHWLGLVVCSSSHGVCGVCLWFVCVCGVCVVCVVWCVYGVCLCVVFVCGVCGVCVWGMCGVSV